MTMIEFLRSLLVHRSLPWIAAGLVVVLTLPSLCVGWMVDDYLHRLAFFGLTPVLSGEPHSPFAMFTFGSGEVDETRRLMDRGFFPWWTFEEIRFKFLRPLTVITHWIDYQLWPNCAALMHLQNIFWYAALVWLTVIFYRRRLGMTWVAGLAGLLYALDEAHGFPTGWIANRNTILAAVFGMLALLAHDRWRRDGWRAGAVLGPLALFAGLLAGEFAVGVCAYLFAYMLCLDRDSWPRRWLSLVPYGMVVGLWGLIYHAYECGAYGSGFYIDPLREPGLFLEAILGRVPRLILGQWAWPPASLSVMVGEGWVFVIWVWGLIFSFLLIFMLYPILRRDRTARFFGVGALLALIPICATFPHERLLFFVGLGSMGLLAQFIQAVRQRADWLPANFFWRVPARGFFYLFLLLHVILAPLSMPIGSLSPAFMRILFENPIDRLPKDPSIAEQDFILVNATNLAMGIYLPAIRLLNHEPYPRATRTLASCFTELEITRIDERSLSIRPKGGFINAPFDPLVRGEAYPMRAGQIVKLDRMSVEVTKLTKDNRPAEAIFRFDTPLEDSSLRWLHSENMEYVPFTPPPIGETITLPPMPITF